MPMSSTALSIALIVNPCCTRSSCSFVHLESSVVLPHTGHNNDVHRSRTGAFPPL
ncbi:hypothetical protein PR003_g1190 [Phytophthora rubi]|uniref:Uncharacterized protein n=1 Tax=Phytophthora rubi TaxID=129364 RepID=A0A6A3PH31_9STRA|nr:hypothetical protein PR002_g1186 [Phytophthora rubi]KAE9051845.1 hypothetical protein PR001_g1048 [Phytophthora rubi]KAE9358575.1 hypothetical protein PR003_g1190 [Phytophthora rubi]